MDSLFISLDQLGILDQKVTQMMIANTKRRRQQKLKELIMLFKALDLVNSEAKVFAIARGISLSGDRGVYILAESQHDRRVVAVGQIGPIEEIQEATGKATGPVVGVATASYTHSIPPDLDTDTEDYARERALAAKHQRAATTARHDEHIRGGYMDEGCDKCIGDDGEGFGVTNL